MNILDRVMAKTGMAKLREAFGYDALYTPRSSGSAISTWVMPKTELGYSGQFSERAETRKTAQIPVADIPEPQPGDSVTYEGVAYRVDQLTGNDGRFYKVALL